MDNDKYIGRLLDNRYEVLEVIGVGGMAVVYKARCHRLNRLVAIKILKDEYSKDEEFCNRFHAEGQAVAMVSHPNIVSVYDVSTSHDADYIVMELIDGISLKQYMEKKGVLNWKETLHFAMQISKALEHAHGRGIVHRDIKPHNVMVLKNGSVKVTDFGIARVMSESHTLTREALGSVHYISPEQAKGGRVDNRSDLYSLGVVMYEMMTGRPPYNGESPVSVAIQHINGGAAMPSTLNPNIPGGLEQIIMKAMAHDVSQRYPSASAMLYDMDEFRKNPVLLFDYNTPATDTVIEVAGGNASAAEETPVVTPPKTTAERVVAEKTEQPRRAPVRRTPGTATPRRETPSRRRPPQRDENRMATIAVIACSAVAVIALTVFLIVLLSGGCSAGDREMIAVPNFLGQDYEQMQDKYAYNANIHIKLNSDQNFSYSEDYEKGQIMDQKPASGTQVAKGTVIYVTVSLGKEPETVLMEDHIGKSLDEVKGYLDALKLDLQVTVVEEFSEDQEAGAIIRTDPMAEERLSTGGIVILYVSKGPEIIELEMEDLSKKTVDEARKWLDKQNLDLTIEVEEVEDLEVEEGSVLRTKPAAGEKLKTGDTVILYVAKGMKTEYMPSVAGMTVDKALAELDQLKTDLSLVIEQVEEHSDDVALGKVIRSEPAYNEAVKTGATVKLFVSATKKAKMPNVVGKDLQAALDLLEYAGFTNIKHDTYVESAKAKDTVVTQSVAKDEEVAVDTQIVLELSKGGAQVTKNHTFGLVDGMAEEYTVEIRESASGKVVHTQKVAADKTELTVSLTGSGKVNYEVWINGIYLPEYGIVTVDFGS